ncbi:phage holin family protein [Zunongwangia sp. SCSIO 43204]|uniref:Putative Holin-X, holin superfamily III n=1 Tax=Zunongwangia mangrovi TaxID=1334022 RepID=A0A1I1DNL6_9FLAO|nr:MULTISPECIES: phage holin family protein [Zunongwangia]UAB85271.1 phage holin family protein [Zunongwangia sp. SCSIO 43204]SFB76471.1 Putative Holin-X, holin superfamily III [Zunongwangia mangrovi]|tara:strand:+ start:1176 stop:1532 length:357 start_codon:yes stop_codon:yes gene_type:complete
MAFEKLTNSIDELNDNVKAFAHSNAEYYKLLIFKQSSKSAISLVTFLIVAFALSTAVAFVSMGIAFAISAALEQPSSGFFIVGGFYLVMIVVFVIFGKKPLTKFMLKKFSREIFNEDD